jgi:hypothetical protein
MNDVKALCIIIRPMLKVYGDCRRPGYPGNRQIPFLKKNNKIKNNFALVSYFFLNALSYI